MRYYVLTTLAANDLEEIANYTWDQWGEEQAKRYIDALEREFDRIASGDVPVRKFSDRHDAVFMRKCKHHYIFARRKGRGIVILAILHENMDFLRHLAKRVKK